MGKVIFMPGRLLKWVGLLIFIGWMLACVGLTAVWIAGRSNGMRPIERVHLFGRWYHQMGNSRFDGSIVFRFYHDLPNMMVGPQMSPQRGYTPEALQWYKKFPTGTHWRGLGFGYDREINMEIVGPTRNIAVRGSWYLIGIPYWAAIAMWLPILALPWMKYQKLRIKRRIERGLCASCGYDLRMTPQRCPECGTVPTSYRARSIQPPPSTTSLS